MDNPDRQALNRANAQAQWTPRPTTAEQTVLGPGQLPAAGQRVILYDGLTVHGARAPVG